MGRPRFLGVPSAGLALVSFTFSFLAGDALAFLGVAFLGVFLGVAFLGVFLGDFLGDFFGDAVGVGEENTLFEISITQLRFL